MATQQPIPTRQYDFQGSAPAVADQVDAELNTLFTVLQGGVGNDHIADNAEIAKSKLAAAFLTEFNAGLISWSGVTCTADNTLTFPSDLGAILNVGDVLSFTDDGTAVEAFIVAKPTATTATIISAPVSSGNLTTVANGSVIASFKYSKNQNAISRSKFIISGAKFVSMTGKKLYVVSQGETSATVGANAGDVASKAFTFGYTFPARPTILVENQDVAAGNIIFVVTRCLTPSTTGFTAYTERHVTQGSTGAQAIDYEAYLILQ
jgi:hypothetical protein